MIEISDAEFSVLSQYLSRICGIEIPSEKRYLFRTRLTSFLEEERCTSFSDLYTRLTAASDKDLENQLIQAMTTHESSFFRDSHPFDVLQRKILPALAKQRLAKGGRIAPRLRILSCGCSLGQEPYTIAMCVREWLDSQRHFTKQDIVILGIDLSRRALERAMRGVYTDLELGRFLPLNLKSRYLLAADGKWRISDEIRGMVNFAHLNLAEGFGFIGPFDIIFCRNVIIYLSAKLKTKVLRQFRNLLNEKGILILGASESLYALSDEFITVHDGPTTYYQPKE